MRRIQPELQELLVSRTAKPYASMMILNALSCVGIKEKGGDNQGLEVELFQKTIGVASKESWCLSFVQSIVAHVESARGETLLPATESCVELWNKSPEGYKSFVPIPGSIVVWQFGDSIKGHCGIVVALSEDGFYSVEGNTSNGFGIEREGDGIYLRYRPFSNIGKFKLLGFINPF